jgi:hypothetical protein
MQSYDWANLINGMFEQIVRYNKSFSTNEGIYFRCKIECEYIGYEQDGNTHHPEWEGKDAKDFHIIILNPHKVFTCITESSGTCSEIPSAELWANDSNHHSCWRDVLLRHLIDIMFYCYDKAFENCPEEFRPQLLSQNGRFSFETSLLGNRFKLVRVEYESIPYNCYHYKLNNIEQIKKSIEVG